MKTFRVEHIDSSWYLLEGAPLGPRICGVARSRKALLAEFAAENLPECAFRLEYKPEEEAVRFRVRRSAFYCGWELRDGRWFRVYDTSVEASEAALSYYLDEDEPFSLEVEA